MHTRRATHTQTSEYDKNNHTEALSSGFSRPACVNQFVAHTLRKARPPKKQAQTFALVCWYMCALALKVRQMRCCSRSHSIIRKYYWARTAQ